MSERTEDIYDSICDVVGKTPMVRLSRIGRDLPFTKAVEDWVKLYEQDKLFFKPADDPGA